MLLTLEKMHLKRLFYLSKVTAPPLVILSEPVRSTAGLHIFTLVERTGSDRMTNRHLFRSQPKNP